MSDYTYTDDLGWQLTVEADVGSVWVAATDDDSARVGVGVKAEDAPAVALAILEAAGFEKNSTHGGPVERAAAWLNTEVRAREAERAERAGREAEDAKVAAFYVDQHETAGIACSPWADLPENLRQVWRDRLRAAREFFTREERPEPRVLNEGDPQPGRDTQWRSKGEARDAYYSIYFDGEYWVIDGRFDRVGRYYWVNIPSTFFPMTEVL